MRTEYQLLSAKISYLMLEGVDNVTPVVSHRSFRLGVHIPPIRRLRMFASYRMPLPPPLSGNAVVCDR
jgi:hypothetical protein